MKRTELAELKTLAARGIEVEIERLNAKLQTLRRLTKVSPNGGVVRKKRKMSVAARKAISRRMKQRWAEKRKASK